MKHIYHEDEFINLLRKKGKGIEIERAIYDMLNDKELLIDKFGRKGTLVNINNLYLFQPIEIQDKHVSVYERMNPITYKPKLIEMEDQEQDEEQGQNQSQGEDQNEEQGQDETKPKPKSKRSNFMEKLMKYYDKAKQGLNEDGWYDHYYETLKLLKIYLSEKDKEILLIFHICESFSFEEDLQAIELFVKDDVTEIEDIIKKYYEQYIIQKDEITGILLMNYALKDPLQIYVLNEHSGSNAGKWIPATYEEKGILSKEIRKTYHPNDIFIKRMEYEKFY
jgi:hypothetical protein